MTYNHNPTIDSVLIMKPSKSNHPPCNPFQYRCIYIIPTVPNKLFIFRLHHKPKLKPPLMEEEIAQMSHSISKIGFPKPAMDDSLDKIPDHLLHIAHDHWTEENSLLVSILRGQDLLPNMVMKALRQVWHPSKRLDIVPRGNNLFACNIDWNKDKFKVEEEQPWFIMKHIVLLQPFSDDINIKEIVFNSLPVWTSFKGLDLDHFSPAVVEWIASKAGKVDVVYPQDFIPRTSEGYRARILIDIDKPVVLTTTANTLTRGDVIVEFLYFNLPRIYCSRCKMIGFTRFDCPCPTVSILVPSSQIEGLENVEEGMGVLPDPQDNTGGSKSGSGVIIMELGNSCNKESETYEAEVEVVQGQNRIGKGIATENNTISEDVDLSPKVFKPIATKPKPVSESGLIFLPHQFLPKVVLNDASGSETRSEVSPSTTRGEKRPRGRPRGSKTVNRSNHGKKIGPAHGGLAFEEGKKRKLANSSQEVVLPYYPTVISPPNTTRDQGFSKLLEYLISPIFAAQVALGFITPENICSYGGQYNQITQTSQPNTQTNQPDELQQLGRQINLNQQLRISQEEEIFNLLEAPMNILPTNEEASFITRDHIGGMEGRGLTAETIELTQSEYNLMRAVATAQHTAQEPTLQGTQQRNLQNAEDYFGQSDGHNTTN